MNLPPVKSAIASAMIAAFVTVFALPAAAGERQLKVITQLLHPISIIKFGQWNEARKRSESWPWSVDAQSWGKRFSSKAEAIVEIKTGAADRRAQYWRAQY